MSESIPSLDNLIDEDVVEEAVSDSTDPSPTIPEIVDTIGEGGVDDNTTPEPRIFENFESFESKDLVMGDFIPPSDQTSRSLLVPIHLLDDDQEDDADKLIFENNKQDFIATLDPFMNGKLDVINTIDEDIWKHPDMLPSDFIRLKNFYWYCKPKLQNEDRMRDTSNRGVKQLLGAALGTLHVKPLTLKRCRRKDRAWRFKATSKHSRELIKRQRPCSSRRTIKPFDPGKFEEQWVNKGAVVTENQRRKKAYDPPPRRGYWNYATRDRKSTRCAGVDLDTRDAHRANPRRGKRSVGFFSFIRLDHPFLQFPVELASSVEYTSRRDALTRRRVLEATVIDRDILRDAGLWGAIEPFLHRTWTHEEASFTCRGWDRIMAIDEDVVYTELLLEFISTIQFAPRAGDPRSRLGESSSGPTSPPHAPDRLHLHHAAGGRREGVGRRHDLLWVLLDPSRFLHLPYALAVALSTHAIGASTSSPLARGYFITRLARSYGILTAPVAASLTALPPSRTTARTLERMRLIELQRPGQYIRAPTEPLQAPQPAYAQPARRRRRPEPEPELAAPTEPHQEDLAARVARIEDQLAWIGEVLLDLATQQGRHPDHSQPGPTIMRPDPPGRLAVIDALLSPVLEKIISNMSGYSHFSCQDLFGEKE
ncbi:hypothetical protein L2E82_45205 [Cichorium intybus]|uniref:Uncharacterized protein n=1 Tax=Cichorium intybus TaxID=13427 RepID=A0ACB8ZWR0_CICIN|nr:hypothetical protein L2E82_45205 [Cichorium intybus]